jgi:hypothetical protein
MGGPVESLHTINAIQSVCSLRCDKLLLTRMFTAGGKTLETVWRLRPLHRFLKLDLESAHRFGKVASQPMGEQICVRRGSERRPLKRPVSNRHPKRCRPSSFATPGRSPLPLGSPILPLCSPSHGPSGVHSHCPRGVDHHRITRLASPLPRSPLATRGRAQSFSGPL